MENHRKPYIEFSKKPAVFHLHPHCTPPALRLEGGNLLSGAVNDLLPRSGAKQSEAEPRCLMEWLVSWLGFFDCFLNFLVLRLLLRLLCGGVCFGLIFLFVWLALVVAWLFFGRFLVDFGMCS